MLTQFKQRRPKRQKRKNEDKEEVDKEDIKAVFLSRNEFEAICFGGDEVTLVTDEPTELYTNYMERRQQELYQLK